MLETIFFAAATVLPIFSLIIIGAFLRRSGTMGKEFISTGSKIVFRLALPAMVFSKMIQLEHIPDEMLGAILVFAAVTIFVYAVVWLIFRRLPAPVHGALVQGSVRGNIAIIGLAIAENAFGLEALQEIVVVLMVMMPFYTVISIIVLSRSSVSSDQNMVKQVVLNIVKNPLIWAIACGLPIGLYGINLPGIATKTLDYISRLAMPLALISIGGSLTLNGMVKDRKLLISTMIFKLVVIPVLVWAGTLLFNITGYVQASLVLAAACPTAVSSFAMAQAMGADGDLTGEMISATTLLSIFTITFWIVLLISMQVA